MKSKYSAVYFKWLVSSALIIHNYAFIFAQTDSTSYQLLWEVKGKGNPKPSYLFGSMHSNDPRLFQFPDSLYTAFVNVDAIVLETDISALFDEYDVRLDLFNLDLFDENRSFANSKQATTTVYGSEDGRPQFLDAYFQQTGYCAGKQFYQLETLQDQIDVTDKLGKMSARAAFNNFIFSKETFTETYLQGNIAALNKMLISQLKGMPGAYDALITNRNRIMANGLDTLIRKQTVFCAVGSGHLYGKEGVINLLRSKGYTVRPIIANYSKVPTKEKQLMLSWKNYTIEQPTFHFSITLSGKPAETIDSTKYNCIYQELGQGNTFQINVRPAEEVLSDCKSEFVSNSFSLPKLFTLKDGTQALEGLVKSKSRGYQWKRIIVSNGLTYELICFGGNKFMHSNRPQQFFNRFELLK